MRKGQLLQCWCNLSLPARRPPSVAPRGARLCPWPGAACVFF